MQFTIATIATVAALLSSANAHILLGVPGTYLSGHDNLPPLQDDGSNYPCGVTSFDQTLENSEGPVLTPGGQGSIQLFGIAVHGGGSCQVSITYDQPPTKNSVWKVLRSYEGGCPIDTPGNLPQTSDSDFLSNKLPELDYTVPVDLPTGKATIAWTWYNKVGNRELYMRCHKATVAGENKDTSALQALPDMFLANLSTMTTCKTVEGGNLKFPNPGENKLGQGDLDPVGDCSGKTALRFSKRHLEKNAL